MIAQALTFEVDFSFFDAIGNPVGPRGLTAKTGNPEVATVQMNANGSGFVTIHKPGKTFIIITAGDGRTMKRLLTVPTMKQFSFGGKTITIVSASPSTFKLEVEGTL